MIDFGIKDAIDILLVAFMLYYIYKLMRTSGSLNIFYGILVFMAVWIMVSQVFEMRLLGGIFDKVMNVGILALIIIFQDEIRRFFLTIGSSGRYGRLVRFFKAKRKKTQDEENPAIMQIVRACDYMGKNRVGALIIVERDMSLDDITNSGERIDANINAQLIKNIFFKNSPLHDGAMIVSQNRIKAAACILPVSHSTDIPKELGLRHRAALGITQQSDAVAVIVSEETGRITLGAHGELRIGISQEELESELSKVM